MLIPRFLYLSRAFEGRLESRQHEETNLQGIQVLNSENLISSI